MALNSKNFNKQVRQTQKTWTDFAKKIQDINEKAFGNSDFGQKLSRGISNMAAPMSRVMPVLSAVGQALANVAELAAKAGAAIGGVLAVGVTTAVKEASALETETVQLNRIFNELDAKKLKDFVMQVQPFMSASRDVIFQAASTLGMAGYSEAEIEKLTQAMADIGAVSGNADQGLQAFSAAFRKMAMTGKLDARTVNMFLKENVNMYQLIAQQMGMTLGEAQEAVSNGMISAATAQQLFLNYASQYFGATQEQSNTLAGSFETVQQLFKNLMAMLGEGLAEKIKDLLGSIQDFLVYALQNVPNLILLIQELWSYAIERAKEFLGVMGEILDVVIRIGDSVSATIRMVTRLMTGGAFKTDTYTDYMEAQGRAIRGNYLQNAMEGVTADLNGILGKYGFAPDQVAAGMAAAKAERIDSTQLAKDVHALAQASSQNSLDKVPVSAFGGVE
jgi:tape measure domain-containing protein